MTRLDIVANLLIDTPMTRHGIQAMTGMGQQRVSEALRELHATVVGYAPPPNKGRPAPIYALAPQEKPRANFDALAIAWNWRPV